MVMLVKKFENTRLPLSALNRNSSGMIGFSASRSALINPAPHIAEEMNAVMMIGWLYGNTLPPKFMAIIKEVMHVVSRTEPAKSNPFMVCTKPTWALFAS
jgi:hypothetical protein